MRAAGHTARGQWVLAGKHLMSRKRRPLTDELAGCPNPTPQMTDDAGPTTDLASTWDCLAELAGALGLYKAWRDPKRRASQGGKAGHVMTHVCHRAR